MYVGTAEYLSAWLAYFYFLLFRHLISRILFAILFGTLLCLVFRISFLLSIYLVEGGQYK
jgi:hypothetical protein